MQIYRLADHFHVMFWLNSQWSPVDQQFTVQLYGNLKECAIQ